MTKHLKGLRLNTPTAPSFTDVLGTDLAWVNSDALCAQTDADLWFPERGSSNTEAIEICQRCPLLKPCEAYAAANNERYGVWGGRGTRGFRPCGTVTAYKGHITRGEKPCPECKQANSEYVRKQRRAA